MGQANMVIDIELFLIKTGMDIFATSETNIH